YPILIFDMCDNCSKFGEITLILSSSKTISFVMAKGIKWLHRHDHTVYSKQKLLITFHHKGLKCAQAKFQVVLIHFVGGVH
ncbi:hypothetical protein ACLVPY_11400, partial [Streptococcus pneumoniae]